MIDRQSEPHAHPASFRDPASRIYAHEGRILRAISSSASRHFRSCSESGLLDELTRKGRLVESRELDPACFTWSDTAGKPAVLLEHRRIPFVSYPYEWPFRALQRAAVLHLDIQLEALASGATLSDASAYNVQFEGARPIFIDVTSFRRYEEGELWLAHRQFCEQFLNPLLLQALTGVPYHSWYRGSLEGIPTGQLTPLLSLRDKARWMVLTHVVLQDRLQQSASQKHTTELRSVATRRLPRRSFQALLEQLRRWIGKLRPAGIERSVWSRYETTRGYDEASKSQKLECVAEFVRAVNPQMLWDFGCNTGEYAMEALRSGAGYVVGFDYDTGALDEAFRRSEQMKVPFLPLFFDAANPSPSQGWRQRERYGLQDRAAADALLALAFEHHITIGRNVPISDFIEWLLSLAPRGLVEFVEKSDPTVQKMLALREDIFTEYTLEQFGRALEARARVIKRVRLADSNRWLFWYDLS